MAIQERQSLSFCFYCLDTIIKTLGKDRKKINILLFTNKFPSFSFYTWCCFRFVLGAVSPAVVVLSMLMLQEQGYGVEKGIPTLLIAASSFDDVVAITGFHIFLGMAFFSKGSSAVLLNHSI